MHSPRVSTFVGFWVTLLAVTTLAVGCAPSSEPNDEPSSPSANPAPSTQPPATPSSSELPDPSDDAATNVRLEVALYPDGTTLGSQYSLECSGAEVIGASQAPNPASACQAIEENPQLLSPQRPANQMCTEIYGGPDRAVVTGTLNGKQINTEFTRTNGCFIAEWDALSPLLGQGGM